MAKQLIVKFLRVQAKKVRTTAEGQPLMEVAGFDGDGKPIMRQATKLITVVQGDPLPDDLADGEVERLQSLGAVITKAKVTVVDDEPKPAAVETPPEPPAAALDLAHLGEASHEDLVAGIAKVGVKKLLPAIGKDAALAARVLAAEKHATKGDPRGTLVKGLEKVIAAGDQT